MSKKSNNNTLDTQDTQQKQPRYVVYDALKDCFSHTIPIMAGYVLMGATFGILLQKAGYGILYSVGMGIFIYAGAMQFTCVALLSSGAGVIEALLISLMINARQIIYGISMLGKFNNIGKKKWYLVFSLTDETFALLNLKRPKKHIDSGYFMFFISLLNQVYWVIGCGVGSIIGERLSIDTRGMGFVMSAIFVVIFIEQWRSNKEHRAALIGLVVSLVCLVIFGKDLFLLPSLVLICAMLAWFNYKGK